MSKPHILLIDDDAFLAGIYAQAFEQEGFDVSLASNGEDGLKLATKDRPNVILLDLKMPKMDGFETLDRLKEQSETAAIPVLIFTNLGQREDIERCAGAGAAGYVIKSHTLPHETVSMVKRVLG